MTADALGPVDRSHDAEIIRDLRAQRAKLDERETTEAWSLRLTFGEIDALLRAVDDRDDAVRRLVGEWEGDVPEPLPVVEVAPYVGELGERPDEKIGAWCLICDGHIRLIVSPTGSWWAHVVHPDDGHDAQPRESNA